MAEAWSEDTEMEVERLMESGRAQGFPPLAYDSILPPGFAFPPTLCLV
jgi:hypothetical protein